MENPVDKTVVNGSEDVASTGGFRHSLPQIPMMVRNPKIAQSKAVAKSEIVAVEHLTTDVEGVGKVVHIGSEKMETDDGLDNKLLEQLESDVSMADVKVDTPEDIQNGDSKTVPVNPPSSVIPSSASAPTECEMESEPSVKSEVEGASETVDSENKQSVKENENKQSVKENEQETSQKQIKGKVKKSPTHQKSNVKQSDSTKKRKEANTAIKKALETNVFASPEIVSPSKRQRKPKKFEDEEETPSKPAKPVPVKIEKPIPVAEDPELLAKHPIQWLVGDLVWAKVATYPWWPCMISHDPYITVYTRVLKRSREYHVQFFGDAAERGWISKGNLLEFKGRAAFDEYCEGVYAQAKNSKEEKKLRKVYMLPASRKKAVDIGVAAAEIALTLTRDDRKAQYTFTYMLPKSKTQAEIKEDLKILQEAEAAVDSTLKPGKKRKHSEVSTPEKNKTAKKRKVESPKADSPSKKVESPSKSPKKRASIPAIVEGSFDVFCQKERENVLSEHPTFTDDMLLDYCRQQWCMMSKKQKARYKSKHNEESDASQEMSASSRRRKPSKKVLEAEENERMVEEVLSGKKSPAPPTDNKPKKSRASLNLSAKPEKVSDEKKPEGKKRRRTLTEGEQIQPQPEQEAAAPMPEQKPIKPESKKRGRPSKGAEPVPVQPLPQEETKSEKETIKAEVVKKRGRPSKGGNNAAEQKPTDKPTQETANTEAGNKQDAIKPSTVIPAKRAKPKKSLSTESNSDQQSESGRSTPSPTPEPLPTAHRVKEEYEYEMEMHKLTSAGPQKKENLCQICEQTGDLVECTGPCQGYFHTDCLAINSTPGAEFKCDECTNGVHSCFVCKKLDATTQRCTVAVCGKFYHPDCVKDYPQAKMDGKGLTCPLHNCHTCLANNLKGTAAKSNGRLLRCVRCPTAYHVGDFCISAGSINLAGFNIVCAKHFQPIPSMKHHSHVNVSWCFSCNKGGTLLCCESCPAAYHAECLNIKFPTGSWYCQDCGKGKRPLYGEIIWIKLGNYRWWPGEICHPRNVPLNIQEKAHQVGEFPVHFLGSHEYFWLHQGRVFSFQDGDKGTGGNSSNKGLTKHFQKGLVEALEAYKVWKEFRDNKEQLELARENKKPAPFKMVKTNIPLGSVTIKKADLSELPRCDCKATQENACGREADCLNAMMMYECHPALCPAGENCHNQFFTKRQYPPQKPHKTEGRGWGLRAMANIKKGQFVNEYVGDLIDDEEVKRRLAKAHEDDVHNFYMMTLDMDRVIDAGPKGNLSRFMNHSCDPNLETQKWNVNGDVRVGLFAMKDIKEGDELTFNYNFDCLGNERTKCQCGTGICSGYLGDKPKTQHAAMTELKKKEKDAKMTKLKKKKKLAAVQRKHDDDCFRCGEGGELLMCDRTTCTKSYHLRCLGRSKPPYGKWDCPWHHCDECGKSATHKCSECPNSFCATHGEKHTKEFDGRIYCLEHEDLLETLAESQSHASDDTDAESTSNQSTVPVGAKSTDKNGVGSGKSKTNGKQQTDAGKETTVEMERKVKEETLPPKKRGPKPKIEPAHEKSQKDKSEKDKPEKAGKKGRRGSVKGEPKGGSVLDETLAEVAVAPMFDDDEEEEFGLVIDIPNF